MSALTSVIFHQPILEKYFIYQRNFAAIAFWTSNHLNSLAFHPWFINPSNCLARFTVVTLPHIPSLFLKLIYLDTQESPGGRARRAAFTHRRRMCGGFHFFCRRRCRFSRRLRLRVTPRLNCSRDTFLIIGQFSFFSSNPFVRSRQASSSFLT